MRWKERQKSSNIEDRRGISIGGIAAVGGGIGIIIFIIFTLLSGGNAGDILNKLISNQDTVVLIQRRLKRLSFRILFQ